MTRSLLWPCGPALFALALGACSTSAQIPADTPATPAPSDEDADADAAAPSVAPTPAPIEDSAGASDPSEGGPGSSETPDQVQATACSTADDCPGGHVCEGQGCGENEGRCAPPDRMCTRDLQTYCSCDGETFRGSGSCPGRRYSRKGPCDGTAPTG